MSSESPKEGLRLPSSPRSGLSTPSECGSPCSIGSPPSLRSSNCSSFSRRSFKKKNQGGFPDSTILLNLYDIEGHPFNYSLGKMLSLGIHHSGIQIGRREFAFTLEGIVVTEPHKIPRCKLTHRILITRDATHDQVQNALRELQKTFKPDNYDPLHLNCNHFTQAFCELVGSEKVPSWVNRAPTMAGIFGTKFRLKPARVTAPTIEWNVMLGAHVEAKEEEAAALEEAEEERNENIFLNEHCNRLLSPEYRRNRFSEEEEEGLLDDEFEEDEEPGGTIEDQQIQEQNSERNSKSLREQHSDTGASTSTTDETPVYPITPRTQDNHKIPFNQVTPPPEISPCWCRALQDIDDHICSDDDDVDAGSIEKSPYDVHKFFNQRKVISASRITALGD